MIAKDMKVVVRESKVIVKEVTVGKVVEDFEKMRNLNLIKRFDEKQLEILSDFFEAGSCTTGIEVCSSLLTLIAEFKTTDLEPEFFIESIQVDLTKAVKNFKESLESVEYLIKNES